MVRQRRGVVLQYHSIDKTSSPISIKEETFAAQMAFLKKEGLKIISLSSYIKGEKGVVITFDDGFENNYKYAFPILKKMGFSATFFIATSYIGRRASWILDYIKRAFHLLNMEHICGLRRVAEEKMLSKEQIQRMAEEGMEFGAHTHTHPSLLRIEKEQMEEEILISKMELEKILGKKLLYFCYPFGEYDERVKEVVKRAGFLLACSNDEGKNEKGLDPYAIQRICVRDSLSSFKFFVLADTRWFFPLRNVLLLLRRRIE